MDLTTRRNLILEGIENCKQATSRAVDLKDHADPAVQSLAEAIHFLSYGAQQIGLALTDEGRVNDLPLK
ncbi:hypothetical protein ACFJIY_07500 [Pimelobacter simplex]|uniref:hypothetical protein n=1 Tax=Nocardioides simplex TaxID=2045 RepID=UPI0036716439